MKREKERVTEENISKGRDELKCQEYQDGSISGLLSKAIDRQQIEVP